MPNHEQVAILDAGAQYGKVIDRRVRALNVESVFLPSNTPASLLKRYRAIIISGGPQSVYSKQAPKFDIGILNLNIPILGICYGMQFLTHHSGGVVRPESKRQDGPCDITILKSSKLFKGLKRNQHVLMSHGDSVVRLPNGYSATAESEGLIAAIENSKLSRYGVQFHPEVDITLHGTQMIKNFLFSIAKCKGTFTVGDRKAQAIMEIREKTGSKNVLVLVSGGVDSAVCAALLYKALGPNRVTAIHIDHGLMRKNESAQIKQALEKIGLNLHLINTSELFYSALKGITNPEKKRKIIGDLFITIAQEQMNKFYKQKNVMLAQGTLRPDLIESASKLASGNAETIKTHHNDSPLARQMRDAGLLIEPLTEYHKDEVRELGKSLGLPKDIIWRQPFPGPGLGIRIICAKKPYSKHRHETMRKLKAFQTKNTKVTLIPIQTVGVQGDGRTYNYLVGLSGTASWKSLFDTAQQIPKFIREVNRVVYVFGKPINKEIIKITPTTITKDVIRQLQEADSIVNQVLKINKLLLKLSQVPVVLFPVDFDGLGNRSIAIRTMITNDFMTGIPAIPGNQIPETVLKEIVEQIIKKIPGISRVVYDLTSKPPGTTEWE